MGRVSFPFSRVPVYFLKSVLKKFTCPKNLLDPDFSLCFRTENLQGELHLPLLSSPMFAVKLAIATCNKRCQYRDRALLQWQRRAGSGIECSLGWMVVLQAPGKLLSQYHFQYVVFSEALKKKKKKDAQVKTQSFCNFEWLISHYCKLLLLKVSYSKWYFKLKTQTVEDLHNKYQIVIYSSNKFQAWAF